MKGAVKQLPRDSAQTSDVGYGLRAIAVIAIVVLLQVASWSAVCVFYRNSHALIALAGMAYLLGLRHALDADHIAAIDNASRSIAGRGDRAAAVGLFFALGHSSVVIVTTLVVAIAATQLGGSFAHWRELGSLFSTLLSVAVLFLVAPRNICAAHAIYKSMRRPPADQVGIAMPIGWVSKLMRPLLRFQVKSWHMLLIGVLFGLGFETATAISMLALAGAQSGAGASIGSVMIIPLVFMAGMTLVDASDSLFMERAYGWALRDPRRHAHYNLVVTSLSGVVALIVGAIELSSVVRHVANDDHSRQSVVELIDAHFDLLGAAIVITFAIIWLVARARARRQLRPPVVIPEKLRIDVVG